MTDRHVTLVGTWPSENRHHGICVLAVIPRHLPPITDYFNARGVVGHETDSYQLYSIYWLSFDVTGDKMKM